MTESKLYIRKNLHAPLSKELKVAKKFQKDFKSVLNHAGAKTLPS